MESRCGLCLSTGVTDVCRAFKDLDRLFFFNQKTAYDMRISDWSSDVCSSDLMMATFQIIVDVPDEAAGEVSLVIAEGSLLEQVATLTAERIGRASCRERVCKSV